MLFANERDNYAYYVNTHSFATCVDKKDGPLSGVFAWGCQVQEDWKKAGSDPKNAPNVQAGLSGLDKQVQAKYPNPPANQKGGIFGLVSPPKSSSSSNTGGTPKSAKCGGCDANNWGCEIGKAFCEFTGAIGDATGSTFDVFGKYMPYFLVGGAAIIAILLIKR